MSVGELSVDKISVSEMSYRQNIRVVGEMSVLSAKCSWAKCPSSKRLWVECPVSEIQSAKSLSAKCLSANCLSTECRSTDLGAYKESWASIKKTSDGV